ncbi:MAG: OsmC family protein [Rhodospirillaceae bacterium]
MSNEVTVRDVGPGKFMVDIAAGEHRLAADEPKDAGGDDTAPAPHELLLAGLGACTVMTLKLYAARKQWPLEHVAVRLTRRKIKASDCPDCRTTEGEVEEMTREITLTGPLDADIRAKLLDIADKCPVHKTLTGEIKIRTALV